MIRVGRSSSAAEVRAVSEAREELEFSEAREELEFCRLLLSESPLGPTSLERGTQSWAKILGALVLEYRSVFDGPDQSKTIAMMEVLPLWPGTIGHPDKWVAMSDL